MADDRHCRAHSSRTGQPCQAWAVRGGVTCVAHGSAPARVRAAAARRLAEAKAQESVARRLALRGVRLSADRHAPTVMLEELDAAIQQADVIAELVAEADQVVKDGEVTALARLLLDQHREIAKQSQAIVKLGISAAKISAEQAEATAREWRAALRESGVLLSAEDQERLAQAFAERLRRRTAVIPRLGHAD